MTRIALLLLLTAAAFRLPGLFYPSEEYFDEVYHAKTAKQYLEGQPPTEWVHPPTAKLLIAVGVWAFGYEPWAWRLAPAIAGTLLAPIFYLFARRVLPTERAALLASVLLLADGVYLVQSRIAMTNIFAVLFQVSAALAVLRAALAERLPFLEMWFAGVLLGLALSTRWTSLWAWGFLGLVLVVVRKRRLFALRELALVAIAFLALPPAIYFLSYVPWMLQHHSPKEVLTVQRDIWNYHAHLSATHPYFSRWWTWPWLYRPTWYFFRYEDGWTRGILALGNPALWWASVPVTAWALVRGHPLRLPQPGDAAGPLLAHGAPQALPRDRDRPLPALPALLHRDPGAHRLVARAPLRRAGAVDLVPELDLRAEERLHDDLPGPPQGHQSRRAPAGRHGRPA